MAVFGSSRFMPHAASAIGITLLLGAGCREPRTPARWAVSIPPLAAVVREVTGPGIAVATLLPPGASPHTFEPRPSDVEVTRGARALFFASPLVDGWVTRLPAPRRIALASMVPPALRRPLPDDSPATAGGARIDVSAMEPHFWTDPLAVRALLRALAETLAVLDPERAADYRANAARFADSLAALDRELAATLRPLAGRTVVLFHTSFAYFLARYGIGVAAVIEPSPGREPTARDLERIAHAARTRGAIAVVTEPQLPRRPAALVRELTGAAIVELDPLGASSGECYATLLRTAARSLRGAAP